MISRVRLGQGKHPTNQWIGGVLWSLTDIIQGFAQSGQMPNSSWAGGVLLSVTDDIPGWVRLVQTANTCMDW
jgi:hypothetical protein